MQRDYWYTDASRSRAPRGRRGASGRIAGERTVRRLGGAAARPRREAPVLFDANIAGSLIGHFVSAASGSSLYRRSSFLLDRLGTQVFAPGVDDPRGAAPARRDGEQPTSTPRAWPPRRASVVEDGVLRGLVPVELLGAQARPRDHRQRRRQPQPASSKPGELDLDGPAARMGRGLLVTELMGQGVNPVTGDYSRGAAGFWVEGGEIATRSRRSPSPATCSTCSPASTPSAATSSCAAPGSAARSWSTE